MMTDDPVSSRALLTYGRQWYEVFLPRIPTLIIGNSQWNEPEILCDVMLLIDGSYIF